MPVSGQTTSCCRQKKTVFRSITAAGDCFFSSFWSGSVGERGKLKLFVSGWSGGCTFDKPILGVSPMNKPCVS